MSRSARVRKHLFDELSQHIQNVDAADVRPVFDRCLVRDIPDEDQIGSIIVPETAGPIGVGKKGLLRLGEVVAIGPGDPWQSERYDKETKRVVRKALGACKACDGTGVVPYGKFGVKVFVEGVEDPSDVECLDCNGDGVHRWEMQVKVGDRVIFDVRKEALFHIGGEDLYLIYEQQSILAVVEP